MQLIWKWRCGETCRSPRSTPIWCRQARTPALRCSRHSSNVIQTRSSPRSPGAVATKCQLRSAAAVAEDAPQSDIGGGGRGRAPEARETGFAAQFPIGESELRLELRAAGGPGKLAQLSEARAAPLEQVVITAGSDDAGAKPALGIGELHQRGDLKIPVPVCREPGGDFGARTARRWRRPALRDRYGRLGWRRQRVKRRLERRRLEPFERRAGRHA